ncbi:MAG: UDP-N-acetylmuramoyl-tripeptide--D-alanyl-D-alanine ligase [Anaerolineaceae bacterium]|nr:UDP-N-acetylmuramoyl-tripeptide--D-alanyl-D-alanine ligase [Anaerolineaceae bacterium]
MINLADIFEALCGARPGSTNLPIREVTVDSRQMCNHGLFVALPGVESDGHDFVGDAFHRGARLALVEKDLSNLFPVIDLRYDLPPEPIRIPSVPFCVRVINVAIALKVLAQYWRDRLNPHVIALAGPAEERAIRPMLSEMLSPRIPATYLPIALAGAYELCLALLTLQKPTQRLIVDFRNAPALKVAELALIARPQVALIAGCNRSSLEGLLPGEQALLDNLPATSLAVLASDCPVERKASARIAAQPFFYGLDPEADLWADEIESRGLEGIQFWLHYRNESIHVRVPLIGHRSVHIALQAAAAGLCDGLTWHDIAAGLRRSCPELRLMTLPSENGALLLDDSYSTSPESTLAVLNLLERMEGRKVAVLGEMPRQMLMGAGNQMVGVRAAEVVQELVAVGEEAYPIAEAARQAGLAAQAVVWVHTAQEAVDHLRRSLQKNDMVLIKGDGELRMDPIVSALGVAS